MALNRLRQKYGTGKGICQNTIYSGSSVLSSWNSLCSDLGETKSIYDEASIATFKTKKGIELQRYVTDRKRFPTIFRPVRIARTIKGNGVFDGMASVEFSVPGKGFSKVTCNGPIAALAPHDQSNCPYLPSITSSAFPNISMHRALWCLQQAANKASEPVHEFGVTLGELAETVSMLISPLNAIYNLSKQSYLLGAKLIIDRRGRRTKMYVRPSPAIKQFGKKTGCEKAKDVALSGCYVVNQMSNFWLTWRFGVKPALKEIDDIQSMDFSEYESSPLRIARKRSTDEWKIYQGTSMVNLGNYLYAYVFDDCRYRTMSQASYAYSLKHGFGLSDFMNSYGLGARHVPQVMWELVPCSFVLDRFVDIGSFIRSITPDPSVTTLATCISEKVEVMLTRSLQRVERLYYANGYYKQKANRFRIWNTRYSRDVGVSVPIHPLLNPKLLKLEQLIDHATLIWQRLPKLR